MSHSSVFRDPGRRLRLGIVGGDVSSGRGSPDLAGLTELSADRPTGPQEEGCGSRTAAAALAWSIAVGAAAEHRQS